MAIAFVSCPKCHAEISTDRKACPHCSEAVPLPADVVRMQQENDLLKQQIKNRETELANENAILRAKLAEVNTQQAQA